LLRERAAAPRNRNDGAAVFLLYQKSGKEMAVLLLVLLAVLAIIAFGFGFTVHWLFIIAVVLALLWLISLFLGGIGGRSRGAWW
jgi:hypothetical protein